MKAAYGTFLTALLVEYCHDELADHATEEFNVTWTRTTPVVVSYCDDAARSYLTGESNLRMGMDVTGDETDVWAFRYACSSAFSPIENEILNSDGGIASVTLGLGERILNGETPELFTSNGYIIYKIINKDDLLLILDPKTGIVTDAYNGITGAYCYHKDITDNRIQQAQNLTSTDPTVRPDWMDTINNSTISLGSFALLGAGGEVSIFGGSFSLSVLSGTATLGCAAVILIPATTLLLLDQLRPGVVAEAEAEGNFNTADYYANNNALDIEWDIINNEVPQGVFDESDEYIRNNPNVQQNLEDIQNLKENIQTVWNEIINSLWESQNWSLEGTVYNTNTMQFEKSYDASSQNQGGGGDLDPRLAKWFALFASGTIISALVANSIIKYPTDNNTNNNSSILVNITNNNNITFISVDSGKMILTRS